ncbi:MAG: tRNA pseudouridine(55) synthase TruB [Candidatus Saccharibacteria bacterium]|nr:tRNA pseudouridine(55) synthase TruB [Candidatus Saccharibacteria bacterium]
MDDEMIENGIILIDKPANMSSFGVVARIRRQLTQHFGRKMKVGHTGTLDPFATGLMILVVGVECKNAEKYSKLDKTYEATIVLGKTSTTGDPEGEVTSVSNKKITRAEIESILPQFMGEITQTPPAFSAIKINGQRAYKLAREGKKVDIPPRKVTIYSLELMSYKYPYLQIKTHVSSGTYIRTLAQDIGEKLGTGAYCSELRRTVIDKYTIENATHLTD